MTESGPKPTLTLSCAEDAEWTLQIEPWGNIHTLAADDRVLVQSTDIATGNAEVSYCSGGLAIWFHSDNNPVLTNLAGHRLEL
jgi:hypothetical protein